MVVLSAGACLNSTSVNAVFHTGPQAESAETAPQAAAINAGDVMSTAPLVLGNSGREIFIDVVSCRVSEPQRVLV